VSQPADTEPDAARVRGKPTSSTAVRPLVVIVDPNDDVRTILSAFLDHDGIDALATADPDQALAWARTRHPHVLLGEHPLNLKDGRLLCVALAEDPETASIPFVAVTARAFPQDLERARKTHPLGVFTKPISPGLIAERLRALFGTR
jgi:CheY-like chemotaxis protein